MLGYARLEFLACDGIFGLIYFSKSQKVYKCPIKSMLMDKQMIEILSVLETKKGSWLNQYEIGEVMSMHHSKLTLPLLQLRKLFLSTQKPHGLEIRTGFKDMESKVELHERPMYYYRITT